MQIKFGPLSLCVRAEPAFSISLKEEKEDVQGSLCSLLEKVMAKGRMRR
jgi:hypothetical protein